MTTLTAEELKKKSEAIEEILLDTVDTDVKESILNPFLVTECALFWYTSTLLYPENGFNLTRTNVVELLTRHHVKLVDRIMNDLTPDGGLSEK
jgi:hypothetical protein